METYVVEREVWHNGTGSIEKTEVEADSMNPPEEDSNLLFRDETGRIIDVFRADTILRVYRKT